MTVLALVIGLALVATVLSPFFVGPGGLLAPGSQVSSPDKLRAMKQTLLERYVDEERAFQRGDLSALAWKKRQEFLVNRYVDAARRLDYLESGGPGSGPGAGTKSEGGAA